MYTYLYECDVGKLIISTVGVAIHELSRQHMYCILKTEPNPNQSHTMSHYKECTMSIMNIQLYGCTSLLKIMY